MGRFLLAEISLTHGGVGPNLRRIARGDDPAIDQNGDAVGEREHGFHIVLDQENSDAAFEFAQHRHHARRLVRAHAGHRLVEQQEPRPRGERHGDLELALLAVAEPVDAHSGARAEPDAFERGLRRSAQAVVAPRVIPETERVTGMRLHRERDIVERGEIAEQRSDLERARQPEVAVAIGRQCGDIAAIEADSAAVRGDLAGQQADQRGLAGAVRADDGVEFAARDVERDGVRGDDAAEALGQPFDLQQRLGHGARLSNSPAMPPCRKIATKSSVGPRKRPGYSVMRDSASSSSRYVTVPISGPNGVARPPSTTMTMRSPERSRTSSPG